MINGVSATSAQPSVQPKSVEVNAKVTESKPQQPSNEIVQISSAAQALKELTETHQQTVQEANKGDIQAKRLLAKEAAEKAASSFKL